MTTSRARFSEHRRPLISVALCLAVLAGLTPPAFASLDAARQLVAQGDPAAALEAVEQELSEDSESVEALFLKGVLLVELRRAEEAGGVFERLIELEPDMPEPYNNLAVIQAAGGDYDQAVATLKKALMTHSSYRTAYENLTKIFTQLASDAYSQALDPEPVERADVVELVLLGSLGQPGSFAVASKRPKAGAQIAATEPATMKTQAPLPVPAPKPESPEPTVASGPDVSTVAPFVESWRQAWQKQNVDAYVASYSDRFVPPNGMSRSAWHENRRERLGAPEFIRVTLAYLDEPQVQGQMASIRFLQSYESNTFQDRVTKTLVLTWEGGGWRILEERSD